MDRKQKLLWMTLGAAAVLGYMASAHANVLLERYEPGRDAVSVWRPVPAKNRAQAERLIGSAVRDLEQAALQSDLSSNERLLTLLRSSQDKLIRAMPPLPVARWLQVDRLLTDIDLSIAHGSAQLGALASPDGDSFGPLAPGRNELAVLAKEGQALLRHTALRSRPDTDDIAWGRHPKPPAAGAAPLTPLPTRGDTLSGSPGSERAWPQFSGRF